MKARIVCCLAVLALPAASADGATRFTIRGAGFGHGVGMSQYGAYGYAKHGWAYDRILGHYYTGTGLGSSGSEIVRVLLQGSVSSSSVSGARSAGGRKLNAGKTYYVRHGAGGGTVALLSASGKTLKTVSGMLTVRGPKLRLGGVGTYRRALEFRPSGTMGVQAVNAVGLENYVRGVVARESPSSWPAEALKAQAVAARTYGITTSKNGFGFDHYADTRSQVYGGVAAETAATDAAVRGTRGKVVTYDGRPVTTYFFSTSGGRTENVENSFGGEGEPWLKSVKDPYDDESPKHRWGPYRWSFDKAAGKLSSYGVNVKGSFKGIDVIKRGVSPRIVSADIVGSGGRTRVSGATIRGALGLYDSWAYFSSIKSDSSTDEDKAEVDRLARVSGPPAPHMLVGEVFPAVAGSELAVLRRGAEGWKHVGSTTTDAEGRYSYTAARAGRYRVRFLLDDGPVVRIR
jgi:stage II sporulation protein D